MWTNAPEELYVARGDSSHPSVQQLLLSIILTLFLYLVRNLSTLYMQIQTNQTVATHRMSETNLCIFCSDVKGGGEVTSEVESVVGTLVKHGGTDSSASLSLVLSGVLSDVK